MASIYMGKIVVLLSVIVFGITALMLLRRGLWPARRGSVPFCRKCDYNLTDLTSDRCPECGILLSEKTIVHGQRHRRAGLIIAGVLFSLPLLLLMVAFLAHANWYRLKPIAWVVSDFQSSTNWGKAARELEYRINGDRLSAGQYSDLIDICLAIQGSNTSAGATPNASYAVAFLGDAYLKKHMSDEQANQFFEQLVQLDFKVRSPVIAGDRIPYSVSERSRCPSSPWWVYITDRDVLLDDVVVETGHGSGSLSGLGTGSGSNGSVVCSSAGTHTLTVTFTHTAYVGPFGDKQTSTLVNERDVELSAKFEVVSEEPANYATMVKDDSLLAELESCFTPNDFRLKAGSSDRYKGIVKLQPPPINIAFDVIVRIGDQEVDIGNLCRRKLQPGTDWFFEWENGNPDIESVELILRSNEQLVRGSVDMFEAWDGEIVYKDIAVLDK